MAKKNNIRSIRFSDELAELIEAQVGRNFSEKFENLVTRCVWELPAAKEELKSLARRTTYEREKLLKLFETTRRLEADIRDMERKAEALNAALSRMIESYSM